MPFFTKDLKDIKGLSTMNARSETISKAPTWREPFKKRRCLVPASAFIEWIHPRMPVILNARDYDRWLDREQTERLPLDLLRPYESEGMEVFEANPKVSSVRNNGPELMRAAVKAAEDGDLPL